MRNLLLKVHKELSEKDFKKIWTEAFFIFDSNVLLDLYRLPDSAKNDLISVLENEDFNKRIWIGFQVLTEFLSNRLNIIGEQKNMFNKVASITEKHIQKITELNNEYNTEIIKLNLNQRHSTISPDEFINTKKLKKTTRIFKNFVLHLNEKEKLHNDVNDRDEIKDIIINIFENKIGNPFSESEIAKIIKEGNERYSDKVPPGYMDFKKEGNHIVKDLKLPKKFGDIFLWKEIIKYINENKLQQVVLVTGDVKEDWWEEKRGRKIGPRRELLNEIYTNCEDLDIFHMYNTSTFLKYAKKEINSEIKDSSIEDTRKLIDLNKRQEIQKTIEISEIYEKINFINRNINKSEKDIVEYEQELHSIEIYRNTHYTDGNISDDIKESLHNLTFKEDELLNKIEISKNRISSLRHYRESYFTRLSFLQNS